MGEETKDEHVKVVLRRLPKFITEKEVLEQVSPLPNEVVSTFFRPANISFGKAAFATLTLIFSEYCDSMLDFERRFDGYVFVDSRGNDSAAVVEAAVFQKYEDCDCSRMKEDCRIGAILTDKYYLEFCQKLEKEKSIPVLTIEEQIRKLNQPDDAKTQLEKLETPLVKYFIEKEFGKRRDYLVRKQRREVRKMEKRESNDKIAKSQTQKNVLDVLMKPGRALIDREKEKMEKQDAKKKERNMLRKKKFLEEKKKNDPERPDGPRENKRKERPVKPHRPSPAKTVGEQQGEDWIKKLTDPKTMPTKKKNDFPAN